MNAVSHAQIKVDSNSKIGMGTNELEPTSKVTILGDVLFQDHSGIGLLGDGFKFTFDDYNMSWDFSPNGVSPFSESVDFTLGGNTSWSSITSESIICQDLNLGNSMTILGDLSVQDVLKINSAGKIGIGTYSPDSNGRITMVGDIIFKGLPSNDQLELRYDASSGRIDFSPNDYNIATLGNNYAWSENDATQLYLDYGTGGSLSFNDVSASSGSFYTLSATYTNGQITTPSDIRLKRI